MVSSSFDGATEASSFLNLNEGDGAEDHLRDQLQVGESRSSPRHKQALLYLARKNELKGNGHRRVVEECQDEKVHEAKPQLFDKPSPRTWQISHLPGEGSAERPSRHKPDTLR